MSDNQKTSLQPVEYTELGPRVDVYAINRTTVASKSGTLGPVMRFGYALANRLPVDIRGNLVNAFAGTSTYVSRTFRALRQQTDRQRRRLVPLVAFARETLASPRAIGAVCPSSPDLARAMAHELRNIGDGLVLELGAGTGNITHALLQQGIAPKRLIAIERSPALAVYLRKRFPSIRVIVGDATRLDQLLGSDAGRVQAVVSGLPLRSLPQLVAREIIFQVQQLLPEDGVFVQFTYDLRRPSVWRERALRKQRTRVVWRNIPPARVDTYMRPAGQSRSNN